MLFCARIDALLNLLRRHWHLSASRYVRIAIVLGLSLMLQRHIRREERLYRETVQYTPIQEDPVFITGHWRSGTTFLHYLMALDRDAFACPTNYQCFFPTIFLTVKEHSWVYRMLKRAMGTRTRLIDNMPFDLASPQEEEWMYIPEGAFSYVEKLFFPKTAVLDLEETLRLSTDEKTRDVTLKIFKKLTFAHNRRILSKSPGHVSRIPLLRELFPKGRFVFLVRNPYEVVVSMMRAKTILGNLLSLQRHQGYDIVSTSKFLAFYFEIMKRNLGLLEPAEYLILRYEDLVKEPLASVKAIYEALGIEYSEKFEEALRAELASFRDYKRNVFEITGEMKEVVYRECQPIFEEFGYAR